MANNSMPKVVIPIGPMFQRSRNTCKSPSRVSTSVATTVWSLHLLLTVTKSFWTLQMMMYVFIFIDEVIFSYIFEFFLFIILAFSVYFMQPRVDDWKAEYLYSTVFHVNNKVPLHDLLVEIHCLSPHSVLSTQGEELIMMLSQMS